MCAAFVVLASGCIERVFEVTAASPLSLNTLRLSGGVTYTIRTTDLTGERPDTVMHVVREDGVAFGSNDECPDEPAGSHGSCLTLRPRWAARFHIIVHAFDEGARSSGTLRVVGSNGFVWEARDQVFGGTVFRTPDHDVGWTRGDDVISVADLAGPDVTACLMLVEDPSDRNAVRVVGSDVQGSWMGGCRMSMGAPSSSLRPAVTSLVVGAAGPNAAAGRVRIYVNDRNNDADGDGDGLGNDLEFQVGTCSGAAGAAACSSPWPVENPMDTDGDGLHDDWELLGIRDSNLPLPRWGANPLHKDAFVEVDQRVGMTQALFPDDWEWIASVYRAGSASDLRNPDLQDGLALHFDVGQSGCAAGSCSTIYGDWGGHSELPVDLWFRDAEADPDYFAEDRWGVFTYAVASFGCGGGRFRQGRAVEFGGDCATPGGSGKDAFAHEWGHRLGLLHGGGGLQADFNCKPNYESYMNYAFAYSAGRFSDGSRPSLDLPYMDEFIGVGEDPSYMLDEWGIVRDGNALDWNRDLVATTTPGRALGFPMWTVGGSCGALEYHREQIGNADAYPDKSPAVAVLDGKVWILYWHNEGDDMAYVQFVPDASLRGDLRRCGAPDAPWTHCGVLTAPEVLPEDLSSSPMFVHCPDCGRIGDEVERERLVGVYARGRDAAARYYLRSIDRTGATDVIQLVEPRPATFDNTVPYLDAEERAVADPALVYFSSCSGEFCWPLLAILYRHVDGTLHEVLVDATSLQVLGDQQIVVAGTPLLSTQLGRDPALLLRGNDLLAFAVSSSDQVFQLRSPTSGGGWTWDAAAVPPTVRSVTQPGVVMAGSGLPSAVRIEYRRPSTNPDTPFPLRRSWTDPSGTFAFDGNVRNGWFAAYRGGSRLALFNGVEVAAVAGLYPTRPMSPTGEGIDPWCLDCDCHTGFRRLAGGGRAGCGLPAPPFGPDVPMKDLCECPNARSILFRPFADGTANIRLEDVNDWIIMRDGMCSRLRSYAECHPSGGTPMISVQDCTLPPAPLED
jgi:hypothetical protein